MSRYLVTIREVIFHDYLIDAGSLEEAEQIARERTGSEDWLNLN